MVSQHEVDFMNIKIEQLEKTWAKLNKNYNARGKSINKLWEKNKELKKQIVTIQKALGNVAFNLGKLETENRIIVHPTSELGEPKKVLVKDIVAQLVEASGYDLEFSVLNIKPTKPELTITRQEIK